MTLKEIRESLRAYVEAKPTPDAWKALCEALNSLEGCSSEDANTIVDYVEEAIADWPDVLRVLSTGSSSVPERYNARFPRKLEQYWWRSYAYGSGWSRDFVLPAARLVRHLGIFMYAEDRSSKQVCEVLDCKENRNLKSVAVVFNGELSFGTEILKILAESPHLTQLELLIFDSVTLDKDALSALITARKKLRALEFSNQPPYGEEVALMLAQKEASQLEALFVSHQSSVVSRICAMTHLTGLKRLELPGGTRSFRSTNAWNKLAQASFIPQLSVLNLSDGWVTDDCLEVFLQTADLTSLRTLDVSRNNLTSRSAALIAQTKSLAGLRVLRLDSNRIDSEGRSLLTASPYLCAEIRNQFRPPSYEEILANALAIVEQEPDEEGWEALCRLFDAHINTLDIEAIEALVEALEDGLDAWPDAIRTAPFAWWNKLRPNHDFPAFSLVRHVEISPDDGVITESSIEQVVTHGEAWQLTHLEVRATDDHMRGIGYITNSSFMQNLRSLVLHDFHGVYDSDLSNLLTTSPNLANLRTLRIADCDINDETVRLLMQSPFVARLRELELSGSYDITDVSLKYIAHSKHLYDLEHLCLKCTRIKDPEASALLLGSPQLPKLKTLVV